MVLVFEKIMRVICTYALHVGRLDSEKDQFYNEMASKWDLQNLDRKIIGPEDFNEQVGGRGSWF